MPPKFKPGGKRFPPKVTPKSYPPQIFPEDPAPSSSSNGLDEESENKFELELCWCIQQLELGIHSGKLKEKQLKDGQKNLNLLKSSSVALVQKRQLMRNIFGDYRAKMVEEEKKLGRSVAKVKFSAAKATENKSVFLRKSHCSDQGPATASISQNGAQVNGSGPSLSSLFSKKTDNQPFTFNFQNSET